MGFATDAIHAGQKPDEVTGAVITPLYLTSTYAQEELGKNKGFEYGRTHNFTRAALEQNLAALEKGTFGIAYASGLAAIHALMSLVKAGDHVIVTDNVYGGTYRLFELIMSNYGLSYSWVDTTKPENILAEIRPNTRMVHIETPTNPMLSLTDIKAVSAICKEHGLLLVVDNTFMSPYFQNPLTLGADIVTHSVTKYINGHSDLIGGINITNNATIHERLRYIQNAAGGVPSPFDCWLTLRSTKTLAVRMKQHNENAQKVAQFLLTHPKIADVIYPGLPDHPQHKLAKEQMSGFGGMVSVNFKEFTDVQQFLKKLKIFTLAESLGGVESLVCHPVSMTHGSVPKEKREKFGLTEKLVRLSVGIEDAEDLINDIRQAIA
ncbi:MAG: PLP-dependent transferase [Ignavibacteriaceae bacterium]|nr:PLP-dependent transferase [Ignavibacteriaceae bacterium]